MFSRVRLLSVALLGLVAWAVIGCNLKLNETPPPKPPTEAKLGTDLRCLAGSVPILSAFFEGTAEAEAVSKTWDCFANAIHLFRLKGKGAESAQVTPQELATFFEGYFLAEGTVLSPEFIAETMRLKQILIGGSRTAITREELSRLAEFATQAKDLSLELRPYMKVFALNWERSGKEAKESDLIFFDQADQALRHAAERIGARIASNRQSYDADHFVSFLEEVRKLADRDWKFVDQIHQAFPLVKKLKKSLVGGNEQIVEADEWSRFGLLGARGYVQYLHYHYFLKNNEHPQHKWQIDDILRSVDGLLSLMGDMVRGKPEGRLLKTEVYEIIDGFNGLFPDLVVTHGLVDETLRLKRVLAGGGLDEVLPREFDRLREKIRQLDPVTQKAAAYWSFYLVDWKPADIHSPEAREYATAAHAALREVAEKLGSLLEADYDLNDLAKLAHELDSTFPPKPGNSSWGAVADRFLPVLISVKGIVVNEPGAVVTREKWPLLLANAANVFSRYLDFEYFVKEEKDLTHGTGLDGLSNLVDSTRSALDRILALRANRTVTFKELDGLVEAVAEADLLPDYLTPRTLKPLIRVLLKRVLLAPELRFAGKIPKGLTPNATSVLQIQFASWVDGQLIGQGLFPDADSAMTGPTLLRELKKLPETRTREELRASINSPLPLALDAGKRVFIAPKESILYRGPTMDRLNLARMMVRLANNAYIEEPARLWSGKGVNVAEANALFQDLKPFAVQLGLIEESNTTFANSRFREANLFVPHADGSDLMNMPEGVDLAMFIMSGLELNKAMKSAFEKSCTVTRARGLEKIALRCYLSVYRRLIPEVFTSMPRFAQVASRMGSKLPKSSGGDLTDKEIGDFEKMMIDFLIATGWKNDQSGLVNLSDVGLVPHVIQYTESIVTKFDSDKNNYVDRNEALRAFPLFRDTMKAVAPEGMDTDDILEGAFAYVLVYGNVPQTLGEQLKFLGLWLPNRDTWPVWADHKKLARVLAYIAEISDKPERVPPPNP